MIHKDVVIPNGGGFCTADKLVKGAPVFTGSYGVPALEISKAISVGILIKTPYHEIIVSPHQRFSNGLSAWELGFGSIVPTVSGDEKITEYIVLANYFDMIELFVNDNFLANGFYLKGY